MARKSYSEVLERYDRAKAFGETRSLPEYAKHLNEIYNTEDFSEGLRDGPWTRFSTRLDQSLAGEGPYGNELTGLPAQLLGGIGGAVGSVFGQEEAGQRVGESLPRGLLDMAPLFIPGVGEAYGGALAAGLTGAAMGGHTYAETGSPKAGVISGAAVAALPFIGGATGSIGARIAGGSRVAGELKAPLSGTFNRVIGNEGNYGAVETGRLLGSQVGMLGTNVASGLLQDRALGGNRTLGEELTSPDLWMSQIPWTVYDAFKAYKAPRQTQERITPLLKKPEVKPPVPEYVPKPGSDEAAAQVAALETRRAAIEADPVSTPEMKAKAFAELYASVMSPEQVAKVKAVQNVAAEPDTIAIAGDVVEKLPNGNWRMRVLDHQNETSAERPGLDTQPPHSTVFINSNIPPVKDPTSGQWIWRGPKSLVKGATVGFAERSELDAELNPQLAPRTNEDILANTGVPVVGPYRQPAYQVLGDPQAGLYDLGTPVGDAFANVQKAQLSSADANGMLAMGVAPQKVEDIFQREKRRKASLFLGEAVRKSKNAVLNMFQGKVLRDAEGNVRVLGGRDVPPGPLPESEFVSRTALSPTLMPLMRQHYPEAFTPDGKVDPTKLVKGLEERPLTEVMKAGAGATPGTRNRQDISHDLANASFYVNEPNPENPREAQDWSLTTQGPEGETEYVEGTPQFNALPERIKQLLAEYKNATRESGLSYSSHYSISTNPRGGTEIAVVAKAAPGESLPSDAHHDVPGLLGTATVEEKTLGELRQVMGKDHPKLARFAGKPDDAVIGVQTEAQSDWEGEVRERDEERNLVLRRVSTPVEKQADGSWAITTFHGSKLGYDTKEQAERAHALQLSQVQKEAQRHPLLPYWERLVADAVIQHGLERGWEGVVVTDAKTAAMTEGHDVNPATTVAITPEQFKQVIESAKLGTVHLNVQPEGATKITFNGPGGQSEQVVKAGEPIPFMFDTETELKAFKDAGLADKVKLDVEQFPGHAQHYGDPDFRIGPQETPGSLQQEFAKATGEENTIRKGGGNVLAVGVHKGTQNNAPEFGTFATPGPLRAAQAQYGGEIRANAAGQYYLEGATVGSPSLTEPHPVTGEVGPKVYATGNFYSFDKIRGGLSENDALSIKEAVMRYDQAVQKATAARKKQELVWTKPEEVAEVTTPEAVKPVDGATPTQNVESARLITTANDIRSADQDAEIARAEVQHVVKSETGRGQAQAEYEPVLGPSGQRAGGFKTRAEALEWQMENVGDDPSIVIRNAGRNADGTERGFYLARVINRGVPLDKPAGEGGSLHEVIAEQTPQMSEDVGAQEISGDFSPIRRPAISTANLLSNLDKAAGSLRVFANATGVDVDTARTIIQQAKVLLPAVHDGSLDLSDLKAANALLVKSSLSEFTDAAELRGAMQKAAIGADEFDGMGTYGHGHPVPHSEELAQQIGIRSSLTKSLQWVADNWDKHKDFSFMSSLLRDLLKALPNLDSDVDVALPGMANHDPHSGWYFTKEGGVRSKINVEHLPMTEEDAVFWGLSLAHEVAHHATKELADRGDKAAVEFKAKLEEVRKALVKSKVFSPELRKVIERSNREGHVDKFATREVDEGGVWDGDRLRREWSKDADPEEVETWFPVIYGLSSPDELISQIFGSPEMVKIAQHTRMAKGLKQTVLDFFENAWNLLVGRKNDTALSQLLTKFSNYLVPQAYAKGYNADRYIADVLQGTGVREKAVASRVQAVRALANTGELAHSIFAHEREALAGVLPVTENSDAVNPGLREALLRGLPKDVGAAAYGMLVDELPAAQALWYRMHQDLSIARQAVAETEQGLLQGTVNPDVKAALQYAQVKVDTLRRELKRQANAVAAFQEMTKLSPEGWEAALAQQLFGSGRAAPNSTPEAESLRSKMALERLEGKGGMSWFAKAFALTQHVKEMYPSAKPVIGRVANEQGLAQARASILNLAFAWDNNKPEGGRSGSVSQAILKSVDRVRSSEAMTEAASDLFRYQNKEGKAQELDFRDPFVRDTLSRFNEKDRKDILQAITSNQNRQKTWANAVLPEAMGRLNMAYTAQLIGSREVGMLPETARSLSTQLYSSLAKLVDPQTSAIGAQELGVLQQKMTPDTYLKALQHAQQLSLKTAAWIKQLQDRPGYTTEQRYGKDQLVMVGPKGEKFRTSGEREKLLRIQQEQAAKGYELLDYVRAEDANAPRVGIREDMLRGLEELDAQNQQLVTQLLGDQPEMLAKVLPTLNSGQSLRDSLLAASPLPRVQRRFVEGREYINMLDNADQFYVRMNNWLRNRLTRAETNVDMMHPEVEANPELRKYLQQHVDNFLTTDNPTARKIVESTYFYKLGFDLGNSALESTQSLTTGMATLIGETGSVGQAFDLWAKAVKDVARYYTTKKWDTQDHHWLMERLKELGQGGIATWGDIVDPDSTAVFDANAGKLTGPVSMLKNGAKKWTTIFTRNNDWIGSIAAFDLARSRGQSLEESLAFAIDVKNRGLFTGGKSQRPVGLWSIKTRPVPQLLAALQNYTLGWFGQMAEHWKKGFGQAPAGLTETQRLGAKKAFVYSIAAQAALAGALGLPGVGQGLALLNQATGLDLKGKMLANLNQLFDEDQESGGTLTGLAMRGIGAYGLPFDPSGRASISVPFLGVDAYKGFNVANLGGAATSTVGDFVEGLLGLARGDFSAADKMLPNVAKRPMQLWQGEGDIRDQRGTLIAQLSPAERWLMAAGLTPSRVQAARDTSDAVKKANLVAQRQKESFVDSLAQLARKGDTQQVQLQLVQYLKEHPEENYKSLAQSVASRVEAQTVPYDWRRDVNPGADLVGLSSPNPSTELLRRQVRQNVTQSLGLNLPTNPRADYLASQLDWLMDSGMSKAQAAESAGLGKRRTARSYIAPSSLGWQ